MPATNRLGDAPGVTVAVEAPSEADARPALPAAARRALAEAAARRAAPAEPAGPHEIDGRGGLEPVRYGDWEVKGLASDF